MAIPLLLYVFFTTCIEPKDLPSDGVRAVLAFLLFQMVLNRMRILSAHLFNVYMDDFSVKLNKLQIGCLYAGTLINHLMYADDLCIFLPVLLV